jgi:hypothetical protein
MDQATVESVLAIVGALSVILSVLASVPAIRDSKTGSHLRKLNGFDVVGILRLVLPLLSKKAPPTPPSDDAN